MSMQKALFHIIIFTLFLIPCLAQEKAPADSDKNNKDSILSTTNQISEAQKKEFIELLKILPHKGEFYTEEAVKQAAPYLPVIFAFAEKDIDRFSIYPFLAISVDIFDQKKYRDYATAHFAEINHPYIKFFAASLLFNRGEANREIIKYLKNTIKSPEQAQMLSDMISPNFEDFKRRVLEYPIDK